MYIHIYYVYTTGILLKILRKSQKVTLTMVPLLVKFQLSSQWFYQRKDTVMAFNEIFLENCSVEQHQPNSL